ncbi:MAG: cation:proton antiporter [bacterium]|nr:cation:proton antiporter [bacterium]
METSSAFFLIGIIIALAAFLGAWASFLKQPIFIAYIVAGLIAGRLIFGSAQNVEIFNLLRDLGLSFVLFLVGLDIRTKELRRFGFPAFKAGLGQVLVTAVGGFLVANLLGFGGTSALYIGIALAFSSTIVTVKLLLEKRDFDSLYGGLTVTMLLLQDLLAIFTLIFISSFSAGSSSFLDIFITATVGAIFLGVGYFLNQNILPYIFERIAYHSELLFIGALAWLFIVAAAASFAGFSIEIGAFLAGVGLANLPQEHQIAARVRPLRDFFILIFFILIGARLALVDIGSIIFPAVVLSLLVLLLKPLSTMFFLSRQGFQARTSFLSGISIAQVSEFSLVILYLGQKVGQISQEVVGVVTLSALITIAVSSYLVKNSNRVYRLLMKYLTFFEPKHRLVEPRKSSELREHFVLVGLGRLGWDILKTLKKHGEKVLVVDFNPAVIEKLDEEGTDCLFGDITDPEIQKGANISSAKMVISTVFDPEDTEELLDLVSKLEIKVPVVVTAATEIKGIDFYKSGASYVIVPRVISSKVVSSLLSGENLKEIVSGEARIEQIELLSDRIKDRTG